MHYDGGSNKIHIGRNKEWGAVASVALNGNVGINNTSPWDHGFIKIFVVLLLVVQVMKLNLVKIMVVEI